MFLPSFRHLIEIEALKTQNLSDLEKISLEHKRISDIETQREKRSALSHALEEESRHLKLSEKQLEIESFTGKLKRLKSQMDLVTNEKEQLALESQLQLVESELNKKEEIYSI